jgi:hypothetical protein
MVRLCVAAVQYVRETGVHTPMRLHVVDPEKQRERVFGDRREDFERLARLTVQEIIES